MYTVNQPLDSYAHQVVMGTILGGSSVVKQLTSINCFLTMQDVDSRWIHCKVQEMGIASVPHPYYIEKMRYYRWRSPCLPVFNDYRNLFYEGTKRKTRMDVLDQLRDIALAVWFLDCGKVIDKKITLRMCRSMDKESIDTTSRYFNEIYLENFIEGKRLMFTPTASKKFVDTIGTSVPQFMYGKLEGML